MFSSLTKLVKGAQNRVKHFSISTQKSYKVAVIGAAGSVGQSLCMLLKLNPLVTHLAVHDVAAMTPGLVLDLSHIDNNTCITCHMGPEGMAEAIRCAHVVMVSAGSPGNLARISEDTFTTNACIVRDVAAVVAMQSPQTMLAIITNPINSMVPVASEVLKRAGTYDPNRVFGVTSVDIVRSRKFIGQILCVNPQAVSVPVIGGHSGLTIIPVLSQTVPPLCYRHHADYERLTNMIRNASTTVEQAKDGGGSASLATAYAAAIFAESLLKAINGERVLKFSYVKSNVTKAAYFSNLLLLGTNGVIHNYGFSCLTSYETYLLQTALPTLMKDIEDGENFLLQ